MSAIWQPQEEGLRDLLTCIEQSRSTDNALQRQVQQVSPVASKGL